MMVANIVLVTVKVLVSRMVVVISDAVEPVPTVRVATDSTTVTLTMRAALVVCCFT